MRDGMAIPDGNGAHGEAGGPAAGEATAAGGEGPMAPAAGDPQVGEAGGARHPVIWHRLVLRGFGPFRDEAEFRFPAGLGHWVSPNESGKSTLLAGLVAVLFGLPGSSDPTRYGQARYRHWNGAARFEGELEFTASDGRRYRLVRDFERHRVRLLRLEGAGAVEEWAGTHNPAASRPAEGYEQALQRLIGVASRHVMLQIYCLEQPLRAPEGPGERPGLAQEVQAMLAGAGSRSPSAALAFLVDGIKRLTRATRDLGVSTHNQRQDRQLEQLEARIRDLEEAIRRDRAAADDLHQVRLQLAELAARRRELEDALERCRRRRDAWQQWQRRAERYRDRTDRRIRMEQAAQQVGLLQAEIAALQREAGARWPGWPELAREGEGEARAVLERLRDLDRRIADLRRELQATLRRQRQAAARSLLAAWYRHRFLARVRQAVEGLSQRVPRLAAAEPATLERLRDVPRKEAELQRHIATLEGAWRARQDALKAWQADAEAARATYADVAGWTPEVAAAALEMVQVRAEIQHLEAENRRRAAEIQRRRVVARWVALVVAALAGLVAGLLAGPRLGLPMGAGLAGLAALAGGGLAWRLLMAGQPTVDPAAEDALRRREEAIRGRLGPWADLPGDRLLEMERRYREWQARTDELERRRRTLEAGGPGEVEARLVEARSQLESLYREVEPFLAGRGVAELPRILAWWEAVARVGREAAQAAEDLARRLGEDVPPEGSGDGRGPGDSGAASDGGWRRLVRMVLAPAAQGEATGEVAAARAVVSSTGTGTEGPAADAPQAGARPAGEVPVDPEGLAAWLQTWDPALWDDPAAEAVRWRDIESRLEAWRRALEGSWDADRGPDPGAVPGWPPSAEAQLERMHLDAEEEARAAGRRADELAEALAGLEAEAGDLRRRWSVLLDPHGGDVERAQEAWSEFLRHQQRWKDKEKELKGLLSAWEVASTADLLGRAAQERDTALLDLKAIEELAAAHPELDARDLNPDRAREALAQLDAEEGTLAAELQRLQEAQVQLASREQAYLRQEPINIAQAEQELAALRAERDALQEELEALVLAHRSLDAAIRDYHAAYRERLEKSASAHFARLTGRPGRRVVLDSDFRVQVREADGTLAVPEQLSQGTRDQLYWSLRVAVAELLAGDVILPFVLDDPFVHWDDRRLGEARQIVTNLARGRQVILLSHRTALAGWGHSVEVAHADPALAAGNGDRRPGGGDGR
ncbi:AAA family ATPase [Thermaerobacter litoralis]